MLISDVTLRDGCHLFQHKMSTNFIIRYAAFAEKAGIDVLEAGHGYGIGGTEPKLNISEHEFLEIVKSQLTKTRLSVHLNPDFCSMDYYMKVAPFIDIVRLACIPGEIYKIIPFLKLNKEIWVSLMFTSKVSRATLLSDATSLHSLNVNTVILFDSAGNYTPDEISERVSMIKNEFPSMRVGFHGHNNLQLAVANSLAVYKSGGEIIDVSLHGIGAGAGNTPLEIFMHLVPDTIDKDEVYKMAEEVKEYPNRGTAYIKNAIKNKSPLHEK